jgi:hypothetical protein
MREVVFAWTDENGALRITWPNWKSKKPHENDAQFLDRIAAKLPKPTPLHPNDLPKTREWRRTWRLKDGKVVEDRVPEGR